MDVPMVAKGELRVMEYPQEPTDITSHQNHGVSPGYIFLQWEGFRNAMPELHPRPTKSDFPGCGQGINMWKAFRKTEQNESQFKEAIKYIIVQMICGNGKNGDNGGRARWLKPVLTTSSSLGERLTL
ncbi:PREDICTED: uncharacterized protein LOC105591083 [Cercocebus atys]|uniref:uncharacterized protein LOC105591083 n=1 Tax=Cercocebus atys TaxID=9531 RepID=UPI0005F4D9C3|nr:PREDICTED: uncharacterized protein LOC105591083 [Cercocebus atys]